MIVVTGARGFVGKYLIERLKSSNLTLSFTTSNKEALNRPGGESFCYLNLKDSESFNNLPEEIGTVIHLAARVPKRGERVSFREFMDINSVGLKKLLSAVKSRGCERFIYASTQMVIEKPFYLPVDEEHPLVPLSDYGLSKAVGERYCLSYGESLGLKVIYLRFARIFGAGQNPGYALTEFIERALKGLTLTVHGEGCLKRDLIYVKDAVSAIVSVLESGACGVFNIGGAKPVSMKELAQAIVDVFGGEGTSLSFKESLEEQGCDMYLDATKAYKELGFKPKYDLKEALLDYKSQLSLSQK